MRRRHRLLFSIVLLSALAMAGADAFADERLRARVDCVPAAERLVHDCTIELTGRKSGKPIEGAEIVINAYMPTMPMVHNVPPVTASPAGKPGLYMARLHLEMVGEWALKLHISGPHRDLIVTKIIFGTGAADAGHGNREPKYLGYADQTDRRLVRRGRAVFAEHCSACHGANLEGELAAGGTPPEGEPAAPPLNGTAHAWHHADGELFVMVKDGPGALVSDRPSRMPAFGAVLADAYIWAIVAYIKTVWPMDVQARHAELFVRGD